MNHDIYTADRTEHNVVNRDDVSRKFRNIVTVL